MDNELIPDEVIEEWDKNSTKNNEDGKYIPYSKFKQAVKASYNLGVLSGEDGMRNEVNKMRVQLGNMLETNKQLWLMIGGSSDGSTLVKVLIPLSVAHGLYVAVRATGLNIDLLKKLGTYIENAGGEVPENRGRKRKNRGK